MSDTPIAKMVRAMIEKGVDIDVIELAVSTAEQASRPLESPQTSADKSADKRRAKDRERKAEIRRNLRNSAEIPQMSENASLYKESIDQEKKKERGSVRGHRLPDRWEPERPDLEAAIALLGHTRADDELEKFRDYWKAQPGSKGVKLDWGATWRNWYRRAAEYGGRNGNGTGNHRAAGTAGQTQSGSDAILAGVAAAAERRARERGAAGQQRQAPRDGSPATGADLELFRAEDGREPH